MGGELIYKYAFVWFGEVGFFKLKFYNLFMLGSYGKIKKLLGVF